MLCASCPQFFLERKLSPERLPLGPACRGAAGRPAAIVSLTIMSVAMIRLPDGDYGAVKRI